MSKQEILLLTIDQKIIESVKKAINQESGYQLEVVSELAGARDAITKEPPDLLILDDQNPNQAGYQFALELIEKYSVIPIILIRSGTDPWSDLDAMRTGVSDILHKPLKPPKLLESIDRAFQQRDKMENWAGDFAKSDSVNLKERVSVHESLEAVGKTVTSSLDLDQVLLEIVDAAVKITGAEEGSLLLVDDVSGDLYMRASKTFQDDHVQTLHVPINDSLAEEVISTGKPIILSEDTPQKIKTAYLVQALVYVPIRTRGDVVGVLGVDNRTSGMQFNDQDLTLVSTLADYASIAIENARLFADSEFERKKLETIINRVGDAVIVVDDELRIVLVNPLAREAFEIGPKDVAGKPINEVISNHILLEMFNYGVDSTLYRQELQLEDNRILNAHRTAVPNVGTVITMQDITHLKELDKIKSEFVNAVSHDLRSPLTAILGYIELIKRVGPVNKEQNEFIQRIQVSIQSITLLINDLLDLGKIESGFDSHKESIQLHPILDSSIYGYVDGINKKDLNVILNAEETLPDVIADPIRIRQVVDNLIGNAIKYTEQGGKIEVDLHEENNQLILRVLDSGRGIPAVDLPFIFDKFYRASNTSPDIPGTGLGLAIVKSIVENHHGRIWVDSKLGQGSTFTIILPVSPRTDD